MRLVVNNTTTPAYKRIQNMQFNTYNDVLEELEQIYGDVHLTVRKRQEFKNLTQDKDSFDVFWGKYQSYIPYLTQNDAELQEDMKPKLAAEYKAAVRGQRYPSIYAMRDTLRLVDTEIITEKLAANASKPPATGRSRTSTNNDGDANDSSDKSAKRKEKLDSLNNTLRNGYNWNRTPQDFVPVTMKQFNDRNNKAYFACKQVTNPTHKRYEASCIMLPFAVAPAGRVNNSTVAVELPTANAGNA